MTRATAPPASLWPENTPADAGLMPEEGEMVVLEADRAVAAAMVHGVCAEVMRAGGKVVWVDGGNDLDPLALSRILRRMRCSTRDGLDRVTVARAFTAYQLSAIIEERLGACVEEESPDLVIVSSLSDLLLDPDVDARESRELMRRALCRLGSLGPGVLVSDRPGALPPVGRRVRAPSTGRRR